MKKKIRNIPHQKSTAVAKPYHGIPTKAEAEVIVETKRIENKFGKQVKEFQKLLEEACRIENQYITIARDLSATDNTFITEKSEIATLLTAGINNLQKGKKVINQASALLDSRDQLFSNPDTAISACLNLVSVLAEMNGILEDEVSNRYSDIVIKTQAYFILINQSLPGDVPNE